jgi:hypothetical protein
LTGIPTTLSKRIFFLHNAFLLIVTSQLWPAISNGDIGALNAVMADMGPWIARAVDTATAHGYRGYIVDLEPVGVNPFIGEMCRAIMSFLSQFADAMHAAGMGVRIHI